MTSTHRNMRTDSMRGEFEQLPMVGKRFVIFGESLTEALPLRVIDTSPVTLTWQSPDGLHFETENSWYRLEVD